MILTLERQLHAAKRIKDDPATAHQAAIDLVESLLRHLAVVAITAYRHAGARDEKVNRILAEQLPWPSMGSWKNFIGLLANVDPACFPDGMHGRFFAPLVRRHKTGPLARACAVGHRLLEYASTGERTPLSQEEEQACSVLEFLDLIVAYRNRFIGHGTQSMTEEKVEVAPILLAAARAAGQETRGCWAAAPIYIAEATSRHGEDFIRLTSLANGAAPIETKDAAIHAGQLYLAVGSGKRPRAFASLFPVAIWSNEDILFLNGAKDFRDIRYLGYGKHEMLETHLNEQAFCRFISVFMGGERFDTIDLDDAQALARAMSLKEAGWRFPSLRPGAEVGTGDRRYRLDRPLGSGGMADVWQATRLEDGHEVAIKFLKDLDNAARFRREARALREFARAEHIVECVDFQFDAHPARRVAFLVMELLRGGSLEDRARNRQSIRYDDVLDWMEAAALGLRAIHDAGAMHRDIKPSNMMFDQEGRLKLGDLGLVGVAGSIAPANLLTSDGLTKVGAAMGTFEFCALEQLQGGAGGVRVGPAADLFSLGASFYYVLTGEFPYGSGNSNLITANQQKASLSPIEGPRRLADLRPDCPPSLSDLVMELVNVDPELRPASAAAVVDRIREARKALRNADKNVNMNLVGDVGSTRIKFSDLLPTWYSRYLFRIWPVIILVVTPLSMFGYHAMFGTLGSLSVVRDANLPLLSESVAAVTAPGVNALPPGMAVFTVARPPLKDHIFQLRPIILILILLLYRSRITIQPLMQRLFRLDQDPEGKHWARSSARNELLARILKSRWTVAAMITIGTVSYIAAYVKNERLASRFELYWFDLRLSVPWHIVNRVSNAGMIIGVILFIAAVVALVTVVVTILRGTRLKVDLHAPDRACGLSVVGRLIAIFYPFMLFVALAVVVAMSIHIQQSVLKIFLMEWLGLIAATAALLFLLFFPMVPIHRQIVAFRDLELERSRQKRQQAEADRRKFIEARVRIDAAKANYFFELDRLCERLRSEEGRVHRAWTWPIRRRRLYAYVALGLAPLLAGAVITTLHALGST